MTIDKLAVRRADTGEKLQTCRLHSRIESRSRVISWSGLLKGDVTESEAQLLVLKNAYLPTGGNANLNLHVPPVANPVLKRANTKSNLSPKETKATKVAYEFVCQRDKGGI
jgi:hypothetical protein